MHHVVKSWYRRMSKSQMDHLQMGREKELLEAVPWKERRMMITESQLHLLQGELLLKKSNHLIQTKNRVLSSKRTASEKLTDHRQRHQSDSHKHFTSLPVAATSLWQENLAVEMLVDVMAAMKAIAKSNERVPFTFLSCFCHYCPRGRLLWQGFQQSKILEQSTIKF